MAIRSWCSCPGVTDVNRAKEIIRSTGLLELKIVEQGPSASKEALTPGTARRPTGMDVVPGVEQRRAMRAGSTRLLPGAQGCGRHRSRSAKRASVARREQPAGGELHAQLRRRREVREGHRRQHRPVARDRPRRKVQSAPRIDSRITSDGRISGSFTQEEVQNLSLILRSGSLPATLTYLEERTIGPSLGADSIRSGVMSSVVGLAAHHRVHAHLLQVVGRQRGGSR